jgi:sugar O-acyltransferase (sialic acid O-acetyltransferase NeuD family)
MNTGFLLIKAPQLGVNDISAKLVKWYFKEGDAVCSGDLLCSLETTKATYDVESEGSGFLVCLVDEFHDVDICQDIAVVAEKQEDVPSIKQKFVVKKQDEADNGIIFTEKAKKLADKLGININEVTPSKGCIVRESDIRQVTKDHVLQFDIQSISVRIDALKEYIPVAVYGAGAGAVTIKETLEAGNLYRVVCFLDDNETNTGALEDLPVLGGEYLFKLKDYGVFHMVVAIADGKIRLHKKKSIEAEGLKLINVVHPTAYISPTVKMGVGNFVKAGAIIETKTRIGDCCIIDNGVVIAHDNTIGDGCHFAPGVSIGSSIHIGNNCIIGIGASISTKVEIGDYCIISVGSAVTKSFSSCSVIDGVPSRKIGESKCRK